MFTPNEGYYVARKHLKCGYKRYLQSEMGTKITANSRRYRNILREDSVISLLNNYLDLVFKVLHASTGNRYKDGNDIRLVTSGPLAFFSSCKLRTSSGKILVDISHANIASLMY